MISIETSGAKRTIFPNSSSLSVLVIVQFESLPKVYCNSSPQPVFASACPAVSEGIGISGHDKDKGESHCCEYVPKRNLFPTPNSYNSAQSNSECHDGDKRHEAGCASDPKYDEEYRCGNHEHQARCAYLLAHGCNLHYDLRCAGS